MIFWTASSTDRIIQPAAPPSFAPMKTNSLQKLVMATTWRRTILVLSIVSVFCVVVISGAAQLKTQKRVTAVQLGDSVGGSRVTIVSDSSLSDYEAFRRGDRFYVKIPLASFAAAAPNFRGNGFEDVRAQNVGDSVIISFKLQSGATARVDQRSNRLDVIFSGVAAGRTLPGTTATTYPTSRNRRAAYNSDSAGPVPPMSPYSSPLTARSSYPGPAPAPDNGTSYTGGTGRNYRSTRPDNRANSGGQNTAGSVASPRQSSQNERSYPVLKNSPGTTPSSAGSQATSTGSNPTKGSNTASTSTAPGPTSPGSTSSPESTSTPGSTTSPGSAAVTAPSVYPTPFNPYAQRPASTPLPVVSSTGESSWDSRMKTVKAWGRLNQNALIIAGLILLALLLGLGIWSRSRRTRLGKGLKKTKGKVVSEKVTGHTVTEAEPISEPSVTAPVVPRASTARTTRSSARAPQPQPASFKTATAQEHREVAQEREVFEL